VAAAAKSGLSCQSVVTNVNAKPRHGQADENTHRQFDDGVIIFSVNRHLSADAASWLWRL
jgi:hypothetical protein